MLIQANLHLEWPHLGWQDKASKALKAMEKWDLQGLALVHQGKFQGSISRDLLAGIPPEAPLSLIKSPLKPWAMNAEQHILASLPLFEESQWNALPVIDDVGKFLGYLPMQVLAKELITSGQSMSDGGFIILGFEGRVDPLSGLIRLLEEEGAVLLRTQRKILSSGRVQYVFQVQSNQVQALADHLERHGYAVDQVFSFQQQGPKEEDRYQFLMKYLNP